MLACQSNLGLFRCTFSENRIVAQKRLIVERNGRQFGPRGVCSMLFVFLTLNMSENLGPFAELFRKLGP